MEWMILPYRRYFDFLGRSRRREYWMFFLFTVLVQAVLEAVFGTRTGGVGPTSANFAVSIQGGVGGVISGLFSLATLIPSLAVSIRRLHDQDRTGWLLLLVLMCLEGTRGPNRFGADPKGRVDARDVFD